MVLRYYRRLGLHRGRYSARVLASLKLTLGRYGKYLGTVMIG